MIDSRIRYFLLICCLFATSLAFGQQQLCPVNFNFGMGDLTNWSAYTGNNRNGNGASAIMQTYPSTSPAPSGTIGARTIQEYTRATTGIQVNTTPGNDPFGNFSILPTVNGYKYGYSITLGSTTISSGTGGSGGYIRGVSYVFNVPTSSVIQPYTITYAYAMVLENGSHESRQQPQFSATLTTSAGIIECASPQYLLPTFGTGNNRGAALDSAAALAQGFAPSSVPSPNANGNNNESRYRVWTKGWREVAMDLSPYRGQQVTLTFEADNCVPGGHFSYSYIALRNVCAGLAITGDSVACTNSTQTYAVPSLADGTYNWTVPNDWTIISGQNTNIITVQIGTSGSVTAHEQNSCANLYDTLPVSVVLPGIGGTVTGASTVCAGNNSQILTLSGNVGSIAKWIASTDNGITYKDIANTSNTLIASNLANTTLFRAVVQNNTVCPADTSTGAIIIVDQKTLGGFLSPSNVNICAMQTVDYPIALKSNVGNVINWQSSTSNGASWSNFVPTKTDDVYYVSGGLTVPTQYRAIVKNGVCPADTSLIATTTLYNTPFPQSTFHPADTTICFNTQALLVATVTIGTSYSWASPQPFVAEGNGVINSLPAIITATAVPKVNADYVLEIQNTGCPNTLLDTFHVKLLPPIMVFAGNDTSIVVDQPLVFQSSASSFTTKYAWTPTTGLDAPNILKPVATITKSLLDGSPTITYILTASTPEGCSASDTVIVRVYTTLPSIFVPSAFTPNGDGKNDIMRPILAGIESFTYFRVYNRYGQLLFQAAGEEEGWDGRINGQLQGSGTYVYAAQAVDYNHRVIKQNGTFVLIR